MERGGHYLKWWEENFREREESLASSKSLLQSRPHFSSQVKYLTEEAVGV